jgi:hypothetical protein
MGSVKADDAYVPHGDGERDEAYSFHVCACFNGTTADDTPMPLHPAAEGERAAVVAWLRALRAGYAGSELMTLAADAIERGSHRREETE